MTKIPSKTVIRFDQSIQDDWDRLQNRRRELSSRLAAIKSETKQINANLGCWVAEGCDHKEYTDRLADLRAEAEAIAAALVYLDDQAAILKRSNSWIT